MKCITSEHLKIRPFVSEPLTCFKCQRFGHQKDQCRSPIRCAIDSQNHETTLCFNKLKQGQPFQTKCPNCNKKHHVWNLKCLQRHARLHKPTNYDPSIKTTVPRPVPNQPRNHEQKCDQNQQQVVSNSIETDGNANPTRLFSQGVSNTFQPKP